MTLPDPPKNNVVFDVMQRSKQAAEFKLMLFIQLVSDHPVYALTLEVKNEDPKKFDVILPVLEDFHTQMVFMAAVYGSFKGSYLLNLAVAAGGILEPGSVDQASNRKQYKRGILLDKLVYECLTRLLMSIDFTRKVIFKVKPSKESRFW